jgi:MbtH protein
VIEVPGKNNRKETSIMPTYEEEDKTVYTVVVNHEEQYSIWPTHKEIPKGWKAVGKEGLKPECLQYVDEVWTDMRPLSLRKRMEGKS